MRVLLIRPNRNHPDQKALADLGIDSVIDPYLEIFQVENTAGANKMLEALKQPASWLVATSTNALSFWQNLIPEKLSEVIAQNNQLLFAAIGTQTKIQLEKLGAGDVLVPDLANSKSLASQLEHYPATRVILPSSNIAMDEIPNRLAPKGFEIISEVVYQTSMVTTTPESVANLDSFDAVLLRSPSAARAFIHYNPNPAVPIICGGRTTANQLSRLGISPSAISDDPQPEAIAKTISRFLENR